MRVHEHTHAEAVRESADTFMYGFGKNDDTELAITTVFSPLFYLCLPFSFLS